MRRSNATRFTPREREEQRRLIRELHGEHYASGEPVNFEGTAAGQQGVLLDVSPTLEHVGAISSKIPLRDQLKGTMFETQAPKAPGLFDQVQP